MTAFARKADFAKSKIVGNFLYEKAAFTRNSTVSNCLNKEVKKFNS